MISLETKVICSAQEEEFLWERFKTFNGLTPNSIYGIIARKYFNLRYMPKLILRQPDVSTADCGTVAAGRSYRLPPTGSKSICDG